MKRLLPLACLLILILLLFTGEQILKTYKPNLFYLGGIQINEANHPDWMNMLKKANMNTVEVTVYARQGEWDSDSLTFADHDEGALSEIRAARKAGIKVILILRISLDHAFPRNLFIWHGMILPQNKVLANWFGRYQSFAMKWAKIAQEEGVDVLSIGSEMNALTSTFQIKKIPHLYAYYNSIKAQNKFEKRALKYKKKLKDEDLWVRGYDNYKDLDAYIDDRIYYNHKWGQQVTFAKEKNRVGLMNKRRTQILKSWKEMIGSIRSIYDGKLTYASNFDNYMDVAFWDDLDFIGINAYFALRDPNKRINSPEHLRQTLIHGWEQVFKGIDEFRMANELIEKPMLFTELGYVNKENTTIEPWVGFGFSVVGTHSNERLIVWEKEKDDWAERKFAMDALYKVVKKNKINLEGILYWKLTTHDYHLPYEPFALHLTPNAKDSLQTSLGQFATLDD